MNFLKALAVFVAVATPFVKLAALVVALVLLATLTRDVGQLAGDVHGSLWGNVFHVVTN